jgi:hypothetical protein
MEEELTSVVQALAKGKSPDPDGHMVDFFKTYWSFMSVDFTTVVNELLECGRFPKGITVTWTHRVVV